MSRNQTTIMNIMKPTLLTLFALLIVLVATDTTQAQLRNDLPSAYNVSGPTLMVESQPVADRRQFGLSSLRMGHSYEMTMGSFGGQVYNQNMYTNSLYMQFNEKMSGRLDVAFAHSPFGSTVPGMSQTGRVFVRNAEFNYALSDRTNINFSFRQIPGGMGYYGNPYGYGGYGYSPYFGRNRYSPYNNPF